MGFRQVSTPGGPYFGGRYRVHKDSLKKSVDQVANSGINSALAGTSLLGPHTPVTALTGLSFVSSAVHNGAEGIKNVIDGIGGGPDKSGGIE